MLPRSPSSYACQVLRAGSCSSHCRVISFEGDQQHCAQEDYDLLTGMAEPAAAVIGVTDEGEDDAPCIAANSQRGSQASGRWRPQRQKMKRATKHRLKAKS